MRVLAACGLVVALASVASGRIETAVVGLVWMLLVSPGVIVLLRVMPSDHPLGFAPAAPAVVTVLGLVPFAVASLVGVHLHWRLASIATSAVVLIAALLLACLFPRAPARARLRRRALALVDDITPARARIVALGLFVLAGGPIAWGQIKDTPQFQFFRRAWLAGVVLGDVSTRWWLGLALAGGGVLLIATAQTGRRPSPGSDWPIADRWAWVGAIAAVLWLARTAFTMPAPGSGVPAWDLDDVTYVAEAVDLLAGAAHGLYEPSLGAELGRMRSSVSVLGAPVIAMLSTLTGITPVELHHSVLPPLLIVLGASASTAALRVLLGSRPLAIPMALAAMFIVVGSAWDYGATWAQYVVLQAAQPKSIHLALLYPLQLATLALVLSPVQRGQSWLAIAIAIVAHATHPFASIVGATWVGATIAAAVVVRRQRVGVLLVLLAVCAALAAETWLASRAPSLPLLELTDRVPGELREARDLLRDTDGRPRALIDPRLLFGADLLSAWAAVLVPVVLVLARRRPRLLVPAVAGLVGVLVCTIEPLGNLVAHALHPSIFWRARWLIPAPVLIGISAVLLLDATAAAWRHARHAQVLGAIAVAAMAVLVPGAARCRRVAPGPEPSRLSRLDPTTHALADWLATQPPTLVLVPHALRQELPLLCADVGLVASRPKHLRPPARGTADEVRAYLQAFDEGRWSIADLDALRTAYPIDVIGIPQSDRGGAQTLEEAGWIRLADAGGLGLWKKNERASRE